MTAFAQFLATECWRCGGSLKGSQGAVRTYCDSCIREAAQVDDLSDFRDVLAKGRAADA